MDFQWEKHSELSKRSNLTISSIKFEPNGQAYCYAVKEGGEVIRLLLSRIEENERLVMGVEEVEVDTCAYNSRCEVIADCGDPLYVLENPNGFSLWQQWKEREWEENSSRATTKLSPRNIVHRGRV